MLFRSDAVVPNPIFSLVPSATVDEGNNWINISWGPLSQTNPDDKTGTTGDWGSGLPLANYVLQASSPAIDYVPTIDLPGGVTLPTTDFFGHTRPDSSGCNADIGAIELEKTGTGTCFGANVSPTTHVFTPSIGTGTTSAAFTLTLHNTGNVTLTGIVVAFTGPFSRSAGLANNCGTTLAATVSCTIEVVFQPTVGGLVTGTASITGSFPVAGSPVALSGTGVAPTNSATLTPATHTYPATTRDCPGTTQAQINACNADPTQTFVLRNTGTTTLTGITVPVLGGTNSTEYGILPVVTTCGGTTTTLTPNATCNIVVQFQPKTAQSASPPAKTATVSVTAGAAGVKTSTLTGTAN